MNVTYRGTTYLVASPQDIATVISWVRLLAELDSWLGLTERPAAVARVA